MILLHQGDVWRIGDAREQTLRGALLKQTDTNRHKPRIPLF